MARLVALEKHAESGNLSFIADRIYYILRSGRPNRYGIAFGVSEFGLFVEEVMKKVVKPRIVIMVAMGVFSFIAILDNYLRSQRAVRNSALDSFSSDSIEDLTQRVNVLIKNNKRVLAIRMVHDTMGWKLMESKAFVDQKRRELKDAGEI
jgi:ribosomal protein L7/L12